MDLPAISADHGSLTDAALFFRDLSLRREADA